MAKVDNVKKLSLKQALAARKTLDEAPVPQKGNIIYINGKFFDCDTGQEISNG